MTTYPNGYGSQLLTIGKLRDRHATKMHPEYAQRLFNCLEAAEGLVGIGGGWRSSATQAANYAKSPGRFAPPGKSFHETHTWSSGIAGYAAVDTVGRGGDHYEAWAWMRDNSGQFGLCTFHDVNGEPWHTQFSDLPKGVSSWKGAGSPDPAALATNSKGWKPAEPDFGLYPLNDGKPVLKIGALGNLVRYLQMVISHRAGGSITVDGDFGPQTASRLRDAQASFQLPATGICDWNGTWQKIDELAGRTADAKEDPPGAKAARGKKTKKPRKADRKVANGFYWVRRGDTPEIVSSRIFGDASQSSIFDPPKPARPGLAKPDHTVRVAGLAGRTTKVKPGEGPWSLITRLYPDASAAALLPRFYDLNGGEHRIFQPGEVVFLDDPS